MSTFLSPVEPAGQDISPASHVPLPWRSGKPRADTRAKGSHVAADAAGKNPLSKHAASERRFAVCKAQSLGSSLIHTIPHQWLPCLEDTALLFTRYQPPNSGLPCVEDTLIHMIPAPHQRLSWVEGHSPSHETSPTSAAAVDRGTLSFTRYQPLISGCRVWKTLLSYSHDTSRTFQERDSRVKQGQMPFIHSFITTFKSH